MERRRMHTATNIHTLDPRPIQSDNTRTGFCTLIYSAETGEQAAAIFVIPQSFTVFGICKIRGFALYETSETISTSEKGFSGARVCSRECGQTIWL